VGSLQLLQRHGIRLPPTDAANVGAWQGLFERTSSSLRENINPSRKAGCGRRREEPYPTTMGIETCWGCNHNEHRDVQH